MIEGFYGIFYTGVTGQTGLGVVVLKDGVVTGADVVGGVLDGNYQLNEATNSYDGTVKLTVPAGATLVTGAPARPEPYTIDIPIALTASDVESGQPVTVQLPTGPVNVIFRKLREFPD